MSLHFSVPYYFVLLKKSEGQCVNSINQFWLTKINQVSDPYKFPSNFRLNWKPAPLK